jgi:zinc protease
MLDRERVVGWHRERVLAGGEPWFIAVGGVDPDEVAGAAARWLGALAPGAARPPVDAPAWPGEPRRTVVHRERAQSALALGFPAPARNDPDLFALQVFSNAISGLGNRLFEELRSRRSLAYTVTAYPIARWLGGAFAAYIATSPEREEEAREALLQELRALADTPLSAEEVERSKRYTIGSWQIRGQTNGAQLGDLAGALLLGPGLAELREFEARIRAVTPAAIQEVLARYFDHARLVEGIVRGTAAPAGTTG